MKIDPQSGVELLGNVLPYADGAEDELGTILAETQDRSSSSDALAGHIHDWPTRYHLSRQRSNLLRPLSIRPGMRILDVGAGTGALCRYLGEQGAEVVALEGSLSRARTAAVRCDDIPNVRVVCGAVDDLQSEAPFDLVVVVGVLEYAGHPFGGGRGPAAFLESIRRLTAPDGAVALAIENQLGLKYLLGCAEDHLGAPWVGIEGYRAPRGIRTYSRRGLAGLLDAAGLPPRRWLYPYPDYKLPTVVLSQQCFSEPDARLLVDQLIRTPVVDHAYPRSLFCDDRAAADTFVEAGLGEDVANSFLVLAGAESAVGRLVDADTLAWHFGSERLSMWLRTKKLARRGGIRTMETEHRVDVARTRGWLSQNITALEPFVAGPTLERLALDAIVRHDVDALGGVLTDWRDYVTGGAAILDGDPGPPAHPFLRASTRYVLAEEFLDVDLANFIREDDGKLQYIDREWCAQGGVDLDLALTRALWNFAYRLITSGADLPWSLTTTVDELAVNLASLCGFVIGPALLNDWRVAEDSLQELVSGVDRTQGGQRRVVDGQLCRAAFPTVGQVPFTTLRRDVVRAQGELKGLREELAAATTLVASTEQELENARTDLAARASELTRVEQQLEHHRARAVQFERRILVRTYRRLVRRASPL